MTYQDYGEEIERLQRLLEKAEAERDALREQVAAMKKLLEEVWAYIPPDCGWDYDVGGYLQDRLSAALAEKQEAKEKP